MAYNVNALRTIAANPAAYPGSPPSPVARTGDGAGAGAGAGAGHEAPKPPAEPVALHEHANSVKEATANARSVLEDLSAMADEAESIDPAVEKTIAAAAAQLAEVDDTLTEIVDKLGAARKEHETMVEDDDEDGY